MTIGPTLEHRIADARARIAADGAQEDLVSELSDLVSDGYAHALALDGRARRASRRAAELSEGLADGDAARELRTLALERRRFEREARALRAELAELHAEFVRLGGTRLNR